MTKPDTPKFGIREDLREYGIQKTASNMYEAEKLMDMHVSHACSYRLPTSPPSDLETVSVWGVRESKVGLWSTGLVTTHHPRKRVCNLALQLTSVSLLFRSPLLGDLMRAATWSTVVIIARERTAHTSCRLLIVSQKLTLGSKTTPFILALPDRVALLFASKISHRSSACVTVTPKASPTRVWPLPPSADADTAWVRDIESRILEFASHVMYTRNSDERWRN